MLKQHAPKLWVEQGFSRREIARRMQAAEPRLQLLMDSRQVIPGAEALDFPSAAKEELVDALNNVISAYDIDMVWPQQSARHDLSGVHSTVHSAASADTIRLVDDKLRFTEWLGDDSYRLRTVEAIGANAVAEQIALAEEEGREICVKPTIGVYGDGYWRLMREPETSFLKDPSRRQINPDIYVAALAHDERQHGPQRTLVMDWLSGPETSIDMLAWHGEPVIHAARTKIDSAHQRIDAEHPAIEHAGGLVRRLGLHGIVSLQYMENNTGDLKILEINPRPAGGSIKSEDAGYGVISAWAKLLAGTADPSMIAQCEGSVLLESETKYSIAAISS